MFLRVNLVGVLAATFILGLGLSNSVILAQDGQVITPDTGQQTPVANTPLATPRDATSSVRDSSEGVGDLGTAIELDEINDVRNQGFVGATAQDIDAFGFIGRPGEISGPPLAEGATFGGGVNDSSNSTVNIGGGGAGAGFGGVANGVTVIRRNMRSRVRSTFIAPRPNDRQVSNQFNNRFVLQPGFQSGPGSFQVSVQNRVAIVNGTVRSQADADRLVRQLNLEPGVSKVVNQLRVVN